MGKMCIDSDISIQIEEILINGGYCMSPERNICEIIL